MSRKNTNIDRKEARKEFTMEKKIRIRAPKELEIKEIFYGSVLKGQMICRTLFGWNINQGQNRRKANVGTHKYCKVSNKSNLNGKTFRSREIKPKNSNLISMNKKTIKFPHKKNM